MCGFFLTLFGEFDMFSDETKEAISELRIRNKLSLTFVEVETLSNET